MEKIIFYDWKVGFNPIAFNKLLRKHLGYSLSQAKKAADDLLVGQKITLEIVAPVDLTGLLAEASESGAKFKRIPKLTEHLHS